MKIGLYGGTFDPIHTAHLLIAQYVKDKFSLDKIIFIPSSVPPHKTAVSGSANRLLMVEAAIADNPAFECSRVEIERAGKSFSFDTISELKEKYQLSKEQVFFIMGSDNLNDFNSWYKPREILTACNVVVFPRSGNSNDLTMNQFYKNLIYLDGAPIIEISSSDIRSRVKKGSSIQYWVPEKVREIILNLQLYR